MLLYLTIVIFMLYFVTLTPLRVWLYHLCRACLRHVCDCCATSSRPRPYLSHMGALTQLCTDGSGPMKTHANTNICIDLCCTSIRHCVFGSCTRCLAHAPAHSHLYTRTVPSFHHQPPHENIFIVFAVCSSLTLQFV